MLKGLMIWLGLSGTLLVSACQTPSVIIENKTVYIIEPPIYQHCLEEPVAPPPVATNKAWKDYVLDLKRYGNDCEAKVNGGREWAISAQQEQQSKDIQDRQSDQEENWWEFW